MRCETCKCKHIGIYGSGRFCSERCARSFSSKEKRREINEKVSATLTGRRIGWAEQSVGKILVERKSVTCGNPKCRVEFLVENWRLTYRSIHYCSRKCGAWKNGGLRPNAGKKGSWYFCREQNKEVYLDSTWELEYARWLDRSGVKWIRPLPFPWTDANGIQHRYYPDFLLIETGVFVDTKNPYLMKRDKPKIRAVERQNNVKICLLTRKDLNKLHS